MAAVEQAVRVARAQTIPAVGGLAEATPNELLAFPAGGLARVFHHFRRQGVPAATLLAGTGLRDEWISDPAHLVSAWQEYAFVRNLRAAAPDTGLGLVAGSCYRLGTFGTLGMAAASCENAGEALAMFLQYVDLSFTQFRVTQQLVGDDWVRIAFVDRYPLGDLRDYFLDRDLACAVTIVRDSIGRTNAVDGIRLRRSRRDVEWAGACQQVLGLVPEIGDDDAVLVRRDLLSQPLPLANALQRQVFEQQCRVESFRRRHLHASMLWCVWQVLASAGEGMPSIEAVARRLAMSERTLRRRLAAEGTGFQDVVDRFRESRARELLVYSREPVEQIADRLGYRESSSFIHAFKRWTGVTPGAFRQYGGAAA